MYKVGRYSAPFTNYISRLLLLSSAFLSYVNPLDYGVPIEIKLWDTQRTPLSHMVDVTNEFGLKILAEHNFLNDNNIAFSPYGLIGILVALYEGVDGESSYQLQRSMQLPWNRNVMRIGFRDIHRTLKTYFVPEEGFLAGLALNNENVTFNENYKKILRFYGFDLENESTNPTPNNITNATTTVAPSSPVTLSTSSSAPLTNSESVSITETTPSKKEETTTNTNTNSLDVSIPKEETTGTSEPSVTIEQTSSTQAETSMTTNSETTTAADTITSSGSTIAVTQTLQQSPTEIIILNRNDDVTPLISTTPQETTTEPSTVVSSTQSTEPDNTMSETASTNAMTSLEIDSSTASTSNQINTTESSRRKRFIDFIFTNPPYTEDHLVYRSFDVGSKEPLIDRDKMFLANGLRNIEVTYMKYDSILKHAFLPHLEASALRLPLDSDRYYLLIVLPMRRGVGELERLLGRMARESDLSDIYSALHPRRVRAAVPSFTVKGHVTLTTDLQKLGVRDVFEPRQRDFTPMTHQTGVYIRSIEQAVSVTIRKYQPDDLKNAFTAHPVYFAATYPFLYFVMDSNIHVALMAGKMVDPLNTRIL